MHTTDVRTVDGAVHEAVAAAPDRHAAAGPAATGDARLALLEAVLHATPAFVHVLRGPDFIFEFANAAYHQLVGRRDLVGRPAFVVLPEAAAGGYPERIARVMATGEPFVGRETPIQLAVAPGGADDATEERHLDFQYLPYQELDADGAPRTVGVIARGASEPVPSEAPPGAGA